MPIILIVLLACLASTPATWAADIASNVRGANVDASHGYAEVGAGLYVQNDARAKYDPAENAYESNLELSFSGEYRRNDFFIEAVEGSFDGLNLGYTLWSGEHWVVDFLGGSFNGFVHIELGDDDEQLAAEAQRNQELIDRDTFYIGTGLRLTRYLQDHIIQFRLIGDVFTHRGTSGSLRIGRQWQLHNWNFHALLGLKYHSAELINFRWGITEAESTARFPTYSTNASVFTETEIGATYPIARDWVFRASFRYRDLPVEIYRSPLSTASHMGWLSTTINYVF
jgi:hypothetical protein